MTNTSTQVAIFNFEGSNVRTLTDSNGILWFVAKDICDVLGLTNVSMAIKALDEDEVSQIDPKQFLGSKNRSNQPINIVSEPGFYSLVNRSSKPEADAFKRWVNHEVLPQIRHTGGYVPAGETELETLARAVLIAQKTIALKEQQLKSQETKVIMAETLIDTEGVCAVSDIARMLTQAGLAIGTKTLFKRMREDGFLSKQKGMNWNRPLQKHIESGLLVIKESIVDHGDGHRTIGITPKVTAKGQEFFLNYYLNK